MEQIDRLYLYGIRIYNTFESINLAFSERYVLIIYRLMRGRKVISKSRPSGLPLKSVVAALMVSR